MRCEPASASWRASRSEEHTSELQSCQYLVCRLLLEKKKAEGAPVPRRRALSPARGRGAARSHALAGGSARVRWLRRHQPDRGAGLHFFFNDTATTEIYTLSLHDALPI